MPVLPLLAIAGGLVVLVWSAGRFVTGAAALAGHLGLAPLLIGMFVIGFGTSAPEMLIAAIASLDGSSGIALGNAFGSNIANIGLILGVAAALSPIAVHSAVLRRELPILLGATLLIIAVTADLYLSRLDAILLLAMFGAVVAYSVHRARSEASDALAADVEADEPGRGLSLPAAAAWTLVGLALLIASSRALVWGAVAIAGILGVSDLIIGLTVVAVGTSLPELASTITAMRRSEHDLALGSVIGSNLFNTLPVVAIAGLINPTPIPAEVLDRDLPVMATLTLVVVLTCAGFGRAPRITRLEGALLAAAFFTYTTYLVLIASG